ncbi:hypothetical protein DFH06DRAFT_1120928 [Mycena polygramma]|nr:hypothetical protein DFH06DRAFT_1120928 [Mycena polygramma]
MIVNISSQDRPKPNFDKEIPIPRAESRACGRNLSVGRTNTKSSSTGCKKIDAWILKLLHAWLWCSSAKASAAVFPPNPGGNHKLKSVPKRLLLRTSVVLVYPAHLRINRQHAVKGLLGPLHCMSKGGLRGPIRPADCATIRTYEKVERRMHPPPTDARQKKLVPIHQRCASHGGPSCPQDTMARERKTKMQPVQRTADRSRATAHGRLQGIMEGRELREFGLRLKAGGWIRRRAKEKLKDKPRSAGQEERTSEKEDKEPKTEKDERQLEENAWVTSNDRQLPLMTRSLLRINTSVAVSTATGHPTARLEGVHSAQRDGDQMATMIASIKPSCSARKPSAARESWRMVADGYASVADEGGSLADVTAKSGTPSGPSQT